MYSWTNSIADFNLFNHTGTGTGTGSKYVLEKK
jgi:hypothetical protein